MDVRIIVPKIEDSRLSDYLRELTKQIATKVDPQLLSWGLLGGEYGYGAKFENGVFMMHPYCWCEQENCRWCSGCDCPDEAYHHFVDGKEVSYKEYRAFYDNLVQWPQYPRGDATKAERKEFEQRWEVVNALSDQANARRSVRHDSVCEFCVKYEGKTEPNFHHKATGLKVWWYKYIGRGMEVEGSDKGKLYEIFNECMRSLEANR